MFFNTFNSPIFSFLSQKSSYYFPKKFYLGGIKLKTAIYKNNLQKNLRNNLIKTVLKPDIVVESGIKKLDDMICGFKAGKITFIEGNSSLIHDIPNRICVNTYKTFSEDSIYIDGGMQVDPYKITRYSKRMEIDPKKMLKHIHISRAFTVHQMSTLIYDMLEPIIKRYNPKTLVICKYPLLYLDSDVEKKEAQILLRNNISHIKKLTKKYNLITILTNPDANLVSNTRNVTSIINENADEIVDITKKEKSIQIKLKKEGKKTEIFTDLKNQTSLYCFGMVT